MKQSSTNQTEHIHETKTREEKKKKKKQMQKNTRRIFLLLSSQSRRFHFVWVFSIRVFFFFFSRSSSASKVVIVIVIAPSNKNTFLRFHSNSIKMNFCIRRHGEHFFVLLNRMYVWCTHCSVCGADNNKPNDRVQVVEGRINSEQCVSI